MSHKLNYKKFTTTINWSIADQIFYGKIEGVTDSISFHGKNKDEVEKAFHEAVDDYIETCNSLGKKIEMIAKDNYVSEDEEKEIIDDLNDMSEDDKKITGTLGLKNCEDINDIKKRLISRGFTDEQIEKQVKKYLDKK